ncbi:Stem-specific protein [Actinidia chinensis var. chinensis]|uniref:Stem-specific protein n=1 Tax=Actinidia chinensis var. chinensis TaxID=1590841 RepID=A0A2R6PXX8_ACTCC|nr:Stem-specific protein [Actinidia chinensis var. chinensis]
MLAIFQKGLADPPKELNSPAPMQEANPLKKPKLPQEILKDFLSFHNHNHNSFSIGFANNALLAFAPSDRSSHSIHQSRRLFCGADGIYCMFLGSLSNLCALNKQYGLSKGPNEAMFVIEAYRTLRDRGPYPAHQVLKELEGSFGFVVYDTKAASVFVALGADEVVKLFWGIGADGSVVIADNLEVIKASCAKSFAPFPTGCMYYNEKGLMSYEHPMNKMKAMPRIDSEGTMCGATFKVDVYSRISTMPRVGSEANWAIWGPQA